MVYYHEQGYVTQKYYIAKEFEEDEDTLGWRYGLHFIVTKISPQEIKTTNLDDGKDLLSETSDWQHSINKKTLKLTLNNVSTINRDQAKTMIYANTEEFEWQCKMLDFSKYKGKQTAYRYFLENTVPKKAGN